jgi:hypothetical protein
VLHGARVGLVGVIGRSARRIDSAGVATQAQGIILTVSFVDSAGPRAASPCRFPAQARAGAGSSGPDATFLLGNRFDVRARCAVPASHPLRRALSTDPAHTKFTNPCCLQAPHNLRRTSLLGRRAQPRVETVDAAKPTMLPGRGSTNAVGGASFAAVLSLAVCETY